MKEDHEVGDNFYRVLNISKRRRRIISKLVYPYISLSRKIPRLRLLFQYNSMKIMTI